ncbi:MAG: OmpH family outer membrane protein [candidate division WOR-3 bacterium]
MRWLLSFAIVVTGLQLVWAKEFKIGYVDTDRVIARCEAAAEAKRLLTQEIGRLEAKVDSLRNDYEAARQEYDSQQLTLSEEGRRSKQADVEQKKRRYEAFLNEVYGNEGRIEQKNRELIAPIVRRIDSAVARIAADEGFSLVVDAAKAGILFAVQGLDLTDMVIDELNREYVPVAPGSQRRRFVVTPIWETNDQAKQERTGQQIRTFVSDFVQAAPNTEVIPPRRTDEVALERNLTDQQIALEQALDIGRSLDVDYVIYGSCSKRDRRISFELSLADVRLSTVRQTQSGEAERPEFLREQVGAVMRVLLSAIQQ